MPALIPAVGSTPGKSVVKYFGKKQKHPRLKTLRIHFLGYNTLHTVHALTGS